MNVFLTIIIAGMLGTGAIPQTLPEGHAVLSNIPPKALLYSVEAKENAQNMVAPEIWEQILSGMSGSGNKEFYEVYLISGSNLRSAKKLCRIAMADHSYSLNIPPASQLLYVGKHVQNGKTTYSVNGIVNKQASWAYISAVLHKGEVNLLTQDENKAFTALRPQ